MGDKVCVVVGVGPGVGLAVARRFGREGYRLALMARRAKALDGFVEELATDGCDATGFVADVSIPESVEAAFNAVREQVGEPEVFVYNPSVLRPSSPSTLDPTHLLEDFQVNTIGALVCVQQVIPAMKEAGRGTILFTGGGLALNPVPNYISLSIGKAGMRNLAIGLHRELAEEGIHVATVTISGFVQPGTYFDPNLIAEKYWELHTQSKAEWGVEINYREA